MTKLHGRMKVDTTLVTSPKLHMGHLPVFLALAEGPPGRMLWTEYPEWLARQSTPIGANNPVLAALMDPRAVVLHGPNPLADPVIVAEHPLWPRWCDLYNAGEFALMVFSRRPAQDRYEDLVRFGMRPRDAAEALRSDAFLGTTTTFDGRGRLVRVAPGNERWLSTVQPWSHTYEEPK